MDDGKVNKFLKLQNMLLLYTASNFYKSLDEGYT